MTDSQAIPALLSQAEGYQIEGKFLHASQLYHRILTVDPTLHQAWIQLSIVQFEMKHYSLAERTLHEGMKNCEPNPEFNYLLGVYMLHEAKFNRASIYFRRLVALDKQLSPALRKRVYYFLGLTQFNLKQYKQAEMSFRKTRKIDPSFEDIDILLGSVCLRIGSRDEAVRILTDSIEKDPLDWKRHVWLGIALQQHQMFSEAYCEYIRAVELRPKDPMTWQLCAEVLISMNRLEEAELYLSKALELDPRHADTVTTAGILSLSRGDRTTAEDCFASVLQFEPSNLKALFGRETLEKQT